MLQISSVFSLKFCGEEREIDKTSPDIHCHGTNSLEEERTIENKSTQLQSSKSIPQLILDVEEFNDDKSSKEDYVTSQNRASQKNNCWEPLAVSEEPIHISYPPEKRLGTENEFLFCCPECCFQTGSMTCLKEHILLKQCMSRHVGSDEVNYNVKHMPYKCSQCPYATSYPEALQNHVIFYHAEHHKFSCRVCRIKFGSSLGLDIHTLLSSTCPDPCRKRVSLSRYIRRAQSGMFVTTCSQCSYEAPTSQALTRHMDIHRSAPDKMYVCKECNCHYKSRSHWTRHMAMRHVMTTR